MPVVEGVRGLGPRDKLLASNVRDPTSTNTNLPQPNMPASIHSCGCQGMWPQPRTHMLTLCRVVNYVRRINMRLSRSAAAAGLFFHTARREAHLKLVSNMPPFPALQSASLPLFTTGSCPSSPLVLCDPSYCQPPFVDRAPNPSALLYQRLKRSS
jgi:hypothetical protein